MKTEKFTEKMDYPQIVERVNLCRETSFTDLLSQGGSAFQVKKEKTIAKNLERIFNAALHISNKGGFHAMSMRSLSRETGLSIGALYNYFSGKDELLEMMQRQRRAITRRILRESIAAETDPVGQLRAAMRTHLYLSEILQPWFYFSYMEAKNLKEKERRAAVESELDTERLFADIVAAGKEQGVFDTTDCRMTASMIKAMLQDWYLKRSKYARRNISVDDYARFLIAWVERCLVQERMGMGQGIGHKDGP